MLNKKYCYNCQYCFRSEFTRARCDAPFNSTIYYDESALGRFFKNRINKKSCHELNKNNDCINYFEIPNPINFNKD
jgi:hypothetical protein